jgi:quercetin dioxygenase-like cupin family protein
MTKKAKLYNWDTIEGEEVRPGVSRKGFRGDQFMMVMNTLEPGMEINPHSHPFEQAVYIVQGKVRFHIGGEVFEGGPGSVIRIPPNIEHYAEPFVDEPVLNLDIFAPLREDYMHLVDYQNFDESEV